MSVFAAVDLGASSGRVMTADSATLELREAHRFPNRPVRVAGTLHWDILGLYQGVLDGLRAAGPVDGIDVDSWAVDYGLLDAWGTLVGNPVHYRDERTSYAVQPPGLYAATGIQFLPINTIFQLGVEHRPASKLLLIPDMLTYWLTGSSGTELTNASTTGLLNPRTRDWSAKAFELIDRDPGLFPPLRRPGDFAGHLLPLVSKETGQSAPVYTVGSHDTASAVAAVPAADENFAYISSGTWSLVGVELAEPILTTEAEAANFTNELGVDGQVRFLRNVMGLWLLEECRREWTVDLDSLLAEAATLPRRSSGRHGSAFPAHRRYDGQDRAGLSGNRPAGAGNPRRIHPLCPRQSRGGLSRGERRRRTAFRPSHRRGPHRRRRAQHAALPAHG